MLDFKVFTQRNLFNKDDEIHASFEQMDDAAVLYCERFMEFLIDLLSQLPTRRYDLLFFLCVLFSLTKV